MRIIDAAPTSAGALRFTLRYDLISPDGKLYRNGTYTRTDLPWDGSPIPQLLEIQTLYEGTRHWKPLA